MSRTGQGVLSASPTTLLSTARTKRYRGRDSQATLATNFHPSRRLEMNNRITTACRNTFTRRISIYWLFDGGILQHIFTRKLSRRIVTPESRLYTEMGLAILWPILDDSVASSTCFSALAIGCWCAANIRSRKSRRCTAEHTLGRGMGA